MLIVYTGILFATIVCQCGLARGTPSGFPASGNGLWYTSPGTSWVKEWLPIGNGYLAGMLILLLCDSELSPYFSIAMLPGGTTQELTQLNIESLWSGGPFQDKVCLPLQLSIMSDERDVYRLCRATMEETNSLRNVAKWHKICIRLDTQSFKMGQSIVLCLLLLYLLFLTFCVEFTPDVEELSTDPGAYGDG